LDILEKHSAVCDCQAGRDATIYALSCRRSGLPEILSLLADTIYRPLIQDFELEQVRKSIEFELEDLNNRTDPEPLLVEMLHEAGFGQTPLANPKICPAENIGKINRDGIYSFMNSIYLPQRTVLTCIGTDHAEFVQMATDKFGSSVRPVWAQTQAKPIDTRLSEWKGGYKIIEKDLSELNQAPNNQLPELAHLVVGLESPAFLNEKDFVTSCVINTLMGGGGSFSAGGPGKGMYSRLYLNVLNRYHFMFSATAYNQSYMDTGVFYIHASSPPQYVDDMCSVIGNELVRMTGPCDSVIFIYFTI
jgi:processing peptidase subunit alpha